MGYGDVAAAVGRVFACYLERDRSVAQSIGAGRGACVYVLEGDPVVVNDSRIRALGAAKIESESMIQIRAEGDSELLLLDVSLS